MAKTKIFCDIADSKTIKEFNKKKIKLNITAVYTVAQVRKINKCLDNKSKSIISIFAGRMSDTGICLLYTSDAADE